MTLDVVDFLARAARSAASADNSQPWRLAWDGALLSVQFRAHGSSGPSPTATNTATLLAMGGVIENIVQMGAGLGLNLVPETGITSPQSVPTYARFPVNDPVRAGAAPVDHPLFSRHTNRFPYQPRALPPALKPELQAMSEGSAQIQVFEDRDSIRQAASLIKSASEVRFRVKEAHEWLAGSLRFGGEDGEAESGMAISSLHLPPGGALLLRLTRSWRAMSALNKLGAYKFMAAADTAPVYAAPALVAIKASNDESGALAAGRLLARAWIRLNEHGIAVHPYYVITDQLARLQENSLPLKLRTQALQIKAGCSSHFTLATTESLYMVLRVGYPERPAPKSNRVPLDTVFTDLTAGTLTP